MDEHDDVLLTDTISEAPPTPIELMTLIYTYLVQENSKKLASENCDGCLSDHPSQMQHMAPGACLSDIPEQVGHFMEQALAKEDQPE